MKPGQYFFPPFRLDPVNEQLWRDTQPLPLRPKTFAVLCYLVERAGELVSKDALLKAVWPDTHGAEGLPKKSIHELRKILGDEAVTPRFIETVARRRGWRFIPPVSTTPPVVSYQLSVVSTNKEAGTPSQLATSNWQLATNLVGRETELAQLHQWLGKALHGERQVIFVTGEAGIGKTAVVDAFLEQVVTNDELLMARGQCIEHHGVGEAYLPVLEALGRLCRTAERGLLIRLLRQQAPTWLVQMPALVDDAELEVLQRKMLGVSQERMLREMADMVEALTAERPLALWMEDLQWSDVSTLDLLLYLAQRRGSARLLVLGTYRPADVIASGHPLKAIKQELHGHRQCEELPLRFLTTPEIIQYLMARFAVEARNTESLQELGRLIRQSTEGNPLFMVNIVDYLVAQGVIAEEAGWWRVRARLEDIAEGTPDSLRQLIEKQLDRLDKEERQVLEVAGVAGGEFSTIAVAAGLEAQEARVEEWCSGLARRGHFLSVRGAEPLPNGMIAGRYGFLHALYQKVLYERLAPAQRVRLHHQIGEKREAVYGNRAGEIAAELAMHFERGQDYQRAVRYLGQAAQNALRRSANREAIDHLTKGLELLKTLPDTPERTQQELLLQVTLGMPLIMTKGYSVPEVKGVYDRARELCREIGETPQLLPVLVGLCRFYVVREEFRTASELGEQMLRLAQHGQDPSLMLVAHMMMSGNLFFQGEFVRAQTQAEQGLALYDPQQHRALIFLYGDDPEVTCRCWVALALWYLGYPDQALERIYHAIPIAQEISHSFALIFARFWTSFLHQSRREVQRVRGQAEAVITLAQEQGMSQFAEMGCIFRGWALAEQRSEEKGIAQIRQGLSALQTIGHNLGRPYFLSLLAEAYSKGGQIEEGLAVLTEALEIAHTTGECMQQAELYRLKGELLLAQESQKSKGKSRKKLSVISSQLSVPNAQSPTSKAQSEAEACFLKAIEIAQKQQAKSLELRAVMSLVRLRQHQAQHHVTRNTQHGSHTMLAEAHTMLSEVYHWFIEGFATQDLQEAKALLESLSL